MNKVEVFKSKFSSVADEISCFMKDANNPLDERWEVFVEFGTKVYDSKWCIMDFQNLPSDFIMYEGEYHAERYETVELKNVVEHIEENVKDYQDIDIEALKQEILQSGYASFDYDW